ncbi:MAG: hypothetical protein ACK4HB_08370, partial [Candidatus Bipolaricaulia bacterium]
PIVGVPSMTAYAERVSFLSGKICVILPDRRDLVYYALYEKNTQITPEMSSTLTAVREQLEQMSDLALCVGPGAERCRAALEPIVTVAPQALNRPSGAVIAQVGAQKFSRSGHDELWTLEPLYLPSPLSPLSLRGERGKMG